MNTLANTFEGVEALPAPKLMAPAGTTDTHMHVYGPPERYRLAPTCPFPPPDGSVAVYRALMGKLGIERVVVVQPSAYGKDNRCTMDAVAELGPDIARAVVVVGPEASEAELETLTRRGARGLRFHMLPGGVLEWEILPQMAARVAEFGWHVQLQFDGRDIDRHHDVLAALPGTVVIDHNGKFLEPVAPGSPVFTRLLRLMETGRFWNKISAYYETSKSGPPGYEDIGRLVRPLVSVAPERMLWATNWPHPTAQENPPDDANLLDRLLEWVPDEALRHRILVDNPAALYGFSSAP